MDVLLVEDETLVRQVEADVLRSVGLVVVDIGSAEEALATAAGQAAKLAAQGWTNATVVEGGYEALQKQAAAG